MSAALPRRGNKGIAAAKKARKRAEAEARNALTLPENRRAYRLAARAAVRVGDE